MFFIGLALALGYELLSSQGIAYAQSGPDPQSRPVPGLTLPGVAGRSGQSTRNNSEAPSDGGDAVADDRPIIPATDPSQDPIDPNEAGDTVPLAPGQRTAPVDGDLAFPGEPTQPQDGVLDTPADAGPTDGVDPVAVDLRETQDRNLFEVNASTDPVAGYDPLLFQIEDLDPLVSDRRIERLFKAEPYDPIGYRIGSFVYFPEAELTAVATNNVLRSSLIESDDQYIELNTASRLVSNWSQHALELRSRGLMNFHDQFPSEDDKAWELEALGRLDFGKRTNLQASVSHDVRQESRGAIDASTTGQRPDVTTDEARASLDHRFNRLSVQLRGAATDLQYSPVTDLGVVTTNSDRNQTTTTEAVRATWEFKPTFSIFTEVELDQRSFEVAPSSDGILRDSDGVYSRTGIDFGTTSTTLRGEVSLGVGRQATNDQRLTEATAFLVDGNLAWRVSDLTSLLLTAQTDIFDTTQTNSAFATSHTGGVELRHKFREYLIGSAGFTYTGRTYEDIPLKESEARTIVGLEYFASRDVILFGRYQHIAFESNDINGDYDADDVRVGVRVRH